MYTTMINDTTILLTMCTNRTNMKRESQEITQPYQHTPDGLRILARLIAREILFRRHASKAKTPEIKETKNNHREDIS
jgi:hypothetical protein